MSETKVKTTVKVEAPIKQFKLAPLVNSLESLRKSGIEYHEQIVVGGRKALDALMSKVYKVYHDAVSNGKGEELGIQIRAKLKAIDPGSVPKEKAHLSNMLIRYVIKDPDPKQVSIYAKALRVVYERKTEPTEFVAVVDEQKGGYSGFTEAGKGSTTPKGDPAAVALSRVVNEAPLDTIAIEWEGDEEVKVLLAHRNDDDEATLHPVNLTTEQRDAMLVRYVAEIDKAAKIAETELPLDRREQIAKATADLAAAQLLEISALRTQAQAKKTGVADPHKKFARAVTQATANVGIAKEELKELKSRK